MNHIGILSPNAIGHLNPMLNLGRELLKRKNKVTIFGTPDMKALVAKSELNFLEIVSDDFPLGSGEQVFEKLGKLTGLEGLKFVVDIYKKFSKVIFSEIPEVIQKAGINSLLIDQSISAGSTIAEYVHIPFITVCNALPFNQEPKIPPYFTGWTYRNSRLACLSNQFAYRFSNYLTREVWELVQQQRKRWNLSKYKNRNDAYSQLAQISQLPKVIDFPRENLPNCFHYIGPFKNPFDIEPISFDTNDFSFDKLNGKSLIYVNLGSIQNRNLKIFNCVAEACKDLDEDFQLLISLGNPKEDPSKIRLPGSPLVFSFPPHQQIINRAHMVVTHAGSTALNCLSVGVPMVAIPITTDQPAMAARIARVGAGEIVPLKKMNVNTVKDAIKKVFTKQEYRENAKKICISIKNAGGVTRAVDIIEQAIATGKPVLN